MGSQLRVTDWQPLMNGKTPISTVTVKNFQCSNLVKSKFENHPIRYFYLNICPYIYNIYYIYKIEC